IAKTFQKVDQAQVVLYLTDAVGDSEEKIQQMLDKLQERISGEQKELFVIANKVDKSKASNDVIPVEIKDKYQKIQNVIYISALQNRGVEELVNVLSESAKNKLSTTEGSIISNARHYAA